MMRPRPRFHRHWLHIRLNMFGKILLTITIILTAVLWLRQRRQKERAAAVAGAADKPEKLNDYRFAAYLFLVLMIGFGASLYYQRWQDDMTLVTVILHSDGASAPVTYQVYKNQLGQRGFTTVDGIRVTVAANERMEVIGL